MNQTALSEQSDPPGPKARWIASFNLFEDSISLVVLGLMALLPILEALLRRYGLNVPGAIPLVAALTLWIAFLGALLATREDDHLSLSKGLVFLPTGVRRVFDDGVVVVGLLVTVLLTRGAYLTVLAEQNSSASLPFGIPTWAVQSIMPVGFGLLAVRWWWVRGRGVAPRIITLVVAAAVLLALSRVDVYSIESTHVVIGLGLGLLGVAAVSGAPIFIVLAGAALWLFWLLPAPITSVADATVKQMKSPVMPLVPLFTFTGYVLAESRASERLVRVFRILLGWLPGGIAVLAVMVCAFFTTFTGASGVTILALGGLLLPVLMKERYKEGFSVGLLTASGSIGLLFPPSLPIILYGTQAGKYGVTIPKMFVAGIIPGFVLVGSVSLLGVIAGFRDQRPADRFEPKTFVRNLAIAIYDAKWELLLPFIMVAYFTGFATLQECAAFMATYAVIVEVFVTKDLSFTKDLPRVARNCSALVGAVLIILSAALGLSEYTIEAELADLASDWATENIESKWMFLLALNGFLLLVGCVMDIFSALIVVVPLILPISQEFGVDPIHLGVIFLANLELGFLTPPVGMNLFLSSVRFRKPLFQVYGAALPFLLILAVAVLLITYVPALTLAPVEWVFGGAAR